MNRPLMALYLALALLAAPRALAQTPDGPPRARGSEPHALYEPEAAFLVRSGSTVVAAELFTHAHERIEAEIIRPTGQRATYVASLRPDETVAQMMTRFYGADTPAGATPNVTALLVFEGDSASVQITRGENTQEQRLDTRPGAIPILSVSFAMVEQLLRRARALSPDADGVPVLHLESVRTPITARVTFPAPDSARIALRVGADEVSILMRVEEARVLSGRVPVQNTTFERVAPAEAVAAVDVRPDYSAPPGASYAAEEVLVQTPAGHALAGTLTLPTGIAGPVPAVVTITGSSPQDRDNAASPTSPYRIFRQVADTLGERGIAVLRLDDRGVGGSTGSLETATTPERADDTRAALAYLRSRPEVDAERLGLVGLSEGGAIAPMIAATDPDLGGLVLLAAPGGTGREVDEYQGGIGAPPVWKEWFLDYDPVPIAQQVEDVPVLVLQGTTDRQVNPANTARLADAFREGGNPDVTVRMFEGLNHLFLPDPDGDPAGYSRLPSFEVPAEVLGVIANWLDERLE